MRASLETHEALARLLEYPRAGWMKSFQDGSRILENQCPSAWSALRPFAEFVNSKSPTELEELFTATFDHSDSCALEVGWHVFGENYTRGSFMAGMRRQLRENGIEENGELPDHLSHLLPLAGKSPPEKAKLLVLECLAPAVRKIQLALDEAKNPWSPVLAAVLELLATHDPQARTVAPAKAPVNDPTALESCSEEGYE